MQHHAAVARQIHLSLLFSFPEPPLNHLNAWRDLRAQGVEIVALCDTDRAKAEQAARDFGVPEIYTDFSQMLGEARLGLVDIVTQVRSHRPLVELSLAAGVPTIVQKPFGLTLDDCAKMTALSMQRAVPLAIHENFRFQLAMRKARDILTSGEIGDANWARISFRTGYDIYSGQPYLREERKFVLNDLGPHVLDLARFLLGEVNWLTAETQMRRKDLAGEDTASMLLRHVSGTVSVVECTYESKRLPDTFPETLLEIEGTQGALILKSGYELSVTSGGKSRSINADPTAAPWMERPWHVVQDSVLTTCQHILTALQQGRPSDVTASDNFKTMALCDAAYQSAESHRAVSPRNFESSQHQIQGR